MREPELEARRERGRRMGQSEVTERSNGKCTPSEYMTRCEDLPRPRCGLIACSSLQRAVSMANEVLELGLPVLAG